MKIARFNLAELILLTTLGLGVFALIVPVIYNSRQRSKIKTCADQLTKTLGNGVMTYASQNDGYMPAWEDGWIKPVSSAISAPVDQSSLPQGGWACPSQGPESPIPTVDSTALWRGSHYGLNQHITSGRTRSDGTALPMWTRINIKKEAAPAWRRVSSPHGKALAADAAGGNSLGEPNRDPVVSGSTPKGFGSSFALPPKPSPGLPYRRHADGIVNVLFLDLHVENLPRFPAFMLGHGTEGYEFWHGEQWYDGSGEKMPPKLEEELAPKAKPLPEGAPPSTTP